MSAGAARSRSTSSRRSEQRLCVDVGPRRAVGILSGLWHRTVEGEEYPPPTRDSPGARGIVNRCIGPSAIRWPCRASSPCARRCTRARTGGRCSTDHRLGGTVRALGPGLDDAQDLPRHTRHDPVGPPHRVHSEACADAMLAARRGATRVEILAFEFEMGLIPAVLDEAKQKGIDVAPKTIPPHRLLRLLLPGHRGLHSCDTTALVPVAVG